ncbi:MAG TPA: protein-glutamate O-methyltransferase CheR [Tepidisphaeraceae bacterium]|jgi:chemotaxis protein methyltransferase CheR|nr:protein-glutamate O-methyltransferase CheR [Tepidisphaeraceae bacterium]
MQLSPQTLQKLIRLIQQWTGLALGPDKEYLIRHRLAPVVRSCGFGGYDELLLRLGAGDATRIQDAVIEAITTKETSFFRDPWLFDVLLQQVIPDLARQHKRGHGASRPIRICSAGASTGQEAYSLAIAVCEFIDSGRHEHTHKDFTIIALDISGEAIDAAKTGLYTRQEVDRGLSEPRLRRFFQRYGEGWQIHEPLRRLVQFRTFNLLRAVAELGAFDLILCRNVLIYFDSPTRVQVCRGLRAALREGGWLALGAAESLPDAGIELEAVKLGRAFLYRRQPAPAG